MHLFPFQIALAGQLGVVLITVEVPEVVELEDEDELELDEVDVVVEPDIPVELVVPVELVTPEPEMLPNTGDPATHPVPFQTVPTLHR